MKKSIVTEGFEKRRVYTNSKPKTEKPQPNSNRSIKEKCKEKDDFDRHIFLYSKGWYERTDVIEDMRIIIGQRAGIEPKWITVPDIISVLIKLSYNYIKNEYQFIEFVLDLSPNNIWKYGPSEDCNFNKALIRRCLSVLRFQYKVDIPFELGKPDPRILPLSKMLKKQGGN